ncbi:hypothetical protein ADUPG1_004292, partial [Aduncisulcus paluster]
HQQQGLSHDDGSHGSGSISPDKQQKKDAYAWFEDEELDDHFIPLDSNPSDSSKGKTMERKEKENVMEREHTQKKQKKEGRFGVVASADLFESSPIVLSKQRSVRNLELMQKGWNEGKEGTEWRKKRDHEREERDKKRREREKVYERLDNLDEKTKKDEER